MTDKKIICKCCNTHIGNFKDNGFSFHNMKAISAIEFNTKETNIKCHECHNWNNFDSENNQSINYKKKSQEHLYYQK